MRLCYFSSGPCTYNVIIVLVSRLSIFFIFVLANVLATLLNNLSILNPVFADVYIYCIWLSSRNF